MPNLNEYRWQSGTTASEVLTFVASVTNTYVTAHPIKGFLHSFEFRTNTAGSLFLIQSGTNNVLYSNIAPSGAAWQRIRPAELYNTGSPYSVSPIPVFEPLILAISGAAANTSGTFVARYG